MRDVTLLHPELQRTIKCMKADCVQRGLPLLITETFRTKAEQDALYAQGRTGKGDIVTNAQYPQSKHCWGIAFDFCRNAKGNEYNNTDGFFDLVADIGKSYGLYWGGDWTSFKDMPHLEMNYSVSYLLKEYGSPDNFRKSWANVEPTVYKTIGDVPDWAFDDVVELMLKGVLKGDGNPQIGKRIIDISTEGLRLLIMCKRMVNGGLE